MFIDLTSTAPTLDYRKCLKQVVVRVADVTNPIQGEGFVIQTGHTPVYKPAVEMEWRDLALNRPMTLKEYLLQPRTVTDPPEVEFEFTGFSAVSGVRDMTTLLHMSLYYDGVEWSLGFDLGEENASMRLWVPLPDYNPICEDLTPLQEEMGVVKDPPEPEKTPRSAWERLKDD